MAKMFCCDLFRLYLHRSLRLCVTIITLTETIYTRLGYVLKVQFILRKVRISKDV